MSNVAASNMSYVIEPGTVNSRQLDFCQSPMTRQFSSPAGSRYTNGVASAESAKEKLLDLVTQHKLPVPFYNTRPTKAGDMYCCYIKIGDKKYAAGSVFESKQEAEETAARKAIDAILKSVTPPTSPPLLPEGGGGDLGEEGMRVLREILRAHPRGLIAEKLEELFLQKHGRPLPSDWLVQAEKPLNLTITRLARNPSVPDSESVVTVAIKGSLDEFERWDLKQKQQSERSPNSSPKGVQFNASLDSTDANLEDVKEIEPVDTPGTPPPELHSEPIIAEDSVLSRIQNSNELYYVNALQSQELPQPRPGPVPELLNGPHSILNKHRVSFASVASLVDSSHAWPVFVTTVESPSSFHFRITSDRHRLDHVGNHEEMQRFYRSDIANRSGARPTELKELGLYAAYTEDTDGGPAQWHRVFVSSILPGGQSALVSFIDHGDIAEMSATQLRTLRRSFIKLPRQAVSAFLATFPDQLTSAWPEAVRNEMKEAFASLLFGAGCSTDAFVIPPVNEDECCDTPLPVHLFVRVPELKDILLNVNYHLAQILDKLKGGVSPASSSRSGSFDEDSVRAFSPPNVERHGLSPTELRRLSFSDQHNSPSPPAVAALASPRLATPPPFPTVRMPLPPGMPVATPRAFASPAPAVNLRLCNPYAAANGIKTAQTQSPRDSLSPPVGNGPEPVKPAVPSFPIVNIPGGGSTMDLMVTSVVSPSQFFVQILSTRPEVENLGKQMAMVYSNNATGYQQAGVEWKVGEFCATVLPKSVTWGRALVLDIIKLGDSQLAEIFFVDTGDRHLVKVSALHPLRPEFAQLPARAIVARLAGVRPDGLAKAPGATEVDGWAVHVRQWFTERIVGRSFRGKLSRAPLHFKDFPLATGSSTIFAQKTESEQLSVPVLSFVALKEIGADASRPVGQELIERGFASEEPL